ncbi:MAG: PTS sugar transporter subunit IIA [Gemmataceae bacterium]
MGNDTMTLEQLARYLRRDAREVVKLADRGELPGRKVAGDWRFSVSEVNTWIEQRIADSGEEELRVIEQQPAEPGEPLIANLLHEACACVPLKATTRASVLSELVTLAEQSWQLYDPKALLEAVRYREAKASTALENGVAVPHPGKPMPQALGEPLIAFGRTQSGLPFGASDNQLTDMFFLVASRDSATHLKVLARLARMFLRPGFLDDLRAEPTAHGAVAFIRATEAELIQA